jgi:DNA-binding cell septation regulator SpoVG
MEIRTIWQDGKWPSFNLELASKEGAEAFLVVKGCKIASGGKGDFVSGPSTKGKDDRYWNHTYFGPKFSEAVLEKALASKPVEKQDQRSDKRFGKAVASQLPPQDDNEIPFN